VTDRIWAGLGMSVSIADAQQANDSVAGKLLSPARRHVA
jgi:hypothetical protein